MHSEKVLLLGNEICESEKVSERIGLYCDICWMVFVRRKAKSYKPITSIVRHAKVWLAIFKYVESPGQ